MFIYLKVRTHILLYTCLVCVCVLCFDSTTLTKNGFVPLHSPSFFSLSLHLFIPRFLFLNVHSFAIVQFLWCVVLHIVGGGSGGNNGNNDDDRNKTMESFYVVGVKRRLIIIAVHIRSRWEEKLYVKYQNWTERNVKCLGAAILTSASSAGRNRRRRRRSMNKQKNHQRTLAFIAFSLFSIQIHLLPSLLSAVCFIVFRMNAM